MSVRRSAELVPASVTKPDGLSNTSGAGPDFVLAIDFGGTKVAIATADLTGQLLQQRRIETNASDGAVQVVERATTVARALLADAERSTGGRCQALGAVSPGVILADRIELAPNVPGWEQLALRTMLIEQLGIQCTVVGNDVKSAAAAEVRWGSLQKMDPAIYISLGTGIAAALVVGGRIIYGAHGASGEIGYNLCGIDDNIGVALGHAPLEERVGGRAIGEQASRLLGYTVDAAEVFAHADPQIRTFLDETLAELAVHIANLAILIDPACVAIGGGMMGAGDQILTVLKKRLQLAVPFPPPLVPAFFGHDASLRGAIALALSELSDK
jgi:Transcriptional regulator/sugar kinase